MVSPLQSGLQAYSSYTNPFQPKTQDGQQSSSQTGERTPSQGAPAQQVQDTTQNSQRTQVVQQGNAPTQASSDEGGKQGFALTAQQSSGSQGSGSGQQKGSLLDITV